MAGFIIALPMASLIAIAFVYFEHNSVEKTILYAKSILIAVPVSYLFFLPFFKFRLPPRQLYLPLVGFAASMGVCTYAFMYYALSFTSIVAPIIIGAQLAIPFGILASALILNENISKNKWILIFILQEHETHHRPSFGIRCRDPCRLCQRC